MRLFRHPPLSMAAALFVVLMAVLVTAFVVGSAADSTSPPVADELFSDAVTAYRAGAADAMLAQPALADDATRNALAAQLVAAAEPALLAATDRYGGDDDITVLWVSARDAALRLATDPAAVRAVAVIADDLALTVIGPMDPIPLPTAPTSLPATTTPSPTQPTVAENTAPQPSVANTLLPPDVARTPPTNPSG